MLNLSADDDVSVDITDIKVSGIYRNVFTEKYEDLSGRSPALKAWDYLVYEK